MPFKKPSHDRDWSPDQAILPDADVAGGRRVRLRNVRCAAYRTADDYDLCHYDETYDLAALESVWFLLSLFLDGRLAHTLLSFHFSDGKKVALSVEVRRKRGERFSVWRMVPRQYELMYVWADESDVIRLRTHVRKEKSFFYPLVLTGEQARTAFLSAVARTNAIFARPEFYHPVSNNCTNNLTCHLRNAGAPLPRFNWRYVFPTSLDSYFMRAGLIAGTDAAAERARHVVIG